MANYRKSFNFRNGVQVDEDNFIVNPVGLVGIGTTVPTELLDVLGNVKVSGILSVNQLYADTTITKGSLFEKIDVGVTSITSGIITASIGVMTYYGDGSKLLNLPTSQWLDVDVGLGFTSIYAQGFVGVGTVDPRFLFQVAGNNDPFNFRDGFAVDNKGNINTPTGIVTARTFVGFGSNLTLLNADTIVNGTLNNSRLPSNISVSGIITASSFFRGRLVGVADTADSITPTADITIKSINLNRSLSSISTVTSYLNTTLIHTQNKIGIGTTNPAVDVHIRKPATTILQLTTDGNNPASIVIGRNVGISTDNAEIRYGNTNIGGYPDSTEKSLDIINYNTGNINNYLHLGNTGINTGNFNWINGQSLSKLMILTYDGRLGVGTINPLNNLHIVGTSTVTGNSFIGGNLSVIGQFTPSNITVSGDAIFNGRIGILTSSPVYPFQVGREPFQPGGGLAIFGNGDVLTAGIITATRFSGNGSTLTNLNGAAVTGVLNPNVVIVSTGIITSSTGFSGDGSRLTNINPASISDGSIEGDFDVNITGIITAISFNGIGTNITGLRPENINDGILSGNLTIDTSSTINASSYTGNGNALTNLNPENISNGNISIVGNITATRFIGFGSNLTNLNPSSIDSGTIGGNIDINVSGAVTATNFLGNGSQLINLKPENIDDGVLDANLDIITGGNILAGIITANGSGLTNLNPENISNGSITANIDIPNCGIITATNGFLSDGIYPVRISVIDIDGTNFLRFTIPGLARTVTLPLD